MKTSSKKKTGTGATKSPLSRRIKIDGILTATDFSDEALIGLRYAVVLAEKLGAALQLLNVVEPVPRFSGLEAVPFTRTTSEVAALARSQLKNLAERETKERMSVTSSVRIGKPFHQITMAAQESAVDLIVIATRGYTGAKHVLLGSTAERVVRHAHCPVLTVRASAGSKPNGFRLEKILVPIDFSNLSRDALPWAISLARQFGSELTLLHVVEKFPIDYTLPGGGQGMMEGLREQARTELGAIANSLRKSSQMHVSTEVRTGIPYDQICDAAQTLAADLIVLTTHGYTGLKHVWLGSTAERVVRHAKCPVLAVRKRIR
jgi:nucleotide-binding universal stress UspA family protein